MITDFYDVNTSNHDQFRATKITSLNTELQKYVPIII